MKCLACNMEVICRILQKHLQRSHNITIKSYYNHFIKTENCGKSKVCRKPTEFRERILGYLDACSRSCLGKLGIEKAKQTNLIKYGSAGYNNREKAKQTCLEIYGTENVYSSDYCKEKTRKTNLERYGVEYISQNADIMNKIKSTNLKKYGVICNLNITEVKNKIGTKEVQDKRANSLRNKPKHSKLEQLVENNLIALGYIDGIDYYCQYKSNEYPFMCDFYLIKQNIYVEVNGYWMHNDHAFDKNNLHDINTLNLWKEKAKNSSQYKYAVHIWADSDTTKRKYSEKINFVELWNSSDIINFTNNLKKEIN